MASNIVNPYSPSPAKYDAWAEGFTKGFMSISSPEPGENISPDDYGAFNEGVSVGLTCADEGVSFGSPCIASGDAENEAIEYSLWTMDAIHLLETGFHVAKHHITKMAGGISILLFAFIDVIYSMKFIDVPGSLPAAGQKIIDLLTSYGVDSLELYCGVCMELESPDCEIYLTPLFTSLEKTRNAAIAVGRQKWVIVSWRTDQSNSYKIVDSNP